MFEILKVILVAEPGQVRIDLPIRIDLEIRTEPVLELDLVAFRVDGAPRHARAGFPRVKIVEKVGTQSADLVVILDPGVHQIRAHGDTAGGTQIKMPTR